MAKREAWRADVLGTLGAKIVDPRRSARQEETGQELQECRLTKAVADRRKQRRVDEPDRPPGVLGAAGLLAKLRLQGREPG